MVAGLAGVTVGSGEATAGPGGCGWTIATRESPVGVVDVGWSQKEESDEDLARLNVEIGDVTKAKKVLEEAKTAAPRKKRRRAKKDRG